MSAPATKLLIIAGARPNFMKVAPLMKAAEFHNSRVGNDIPRFNCCLVHTGQHYDERMSEVFFRELGIPAPDVNLEVGSGSHAAQTAQIMLKFEPVLLARNPDWVVVVGDVNSTMACTLVASKLGIKVAHVEAGLRSFDRQMPEEINRLVTDAIADLLLTPSEDASENLRKEGVAEQKIRLVGNIMIDALIANLAASRASEVLQRLHVAPREYVYVTLHRPSNVDSPEVLRTIIGELERLSERLPVLFPMHPRTKRTIADSGILRAGYANFKIIDPVGYHDSLCLTENAQFVITDSGGLQEETTYFQTPCLTVRNNTERPVTITHGTNKLTAPDRLAGDIAELTGSGAEARLEKRVPPMWDGHTAERILGCFLSDDLKD